MPSKQGAKAATSTKAAELHERFALEYLRDLNATAAYKRIRPKVSDRTAATNGWRLLRNADVQALLEKHRSRVLGRLEVTADRVLEELAVCGFSDPLGDYDVDDLGRLTLSETAHPAAGRALASVKRKIRTGGDEDRPWTEYECEFRLWPKVDALKALGNHLGLFKESDPAGEGCEIILGEGEEVRLIVRGKAARR